MGTDVAAVRRGAKAFLWQAGCRGAELRASQRLCAGAQLLVTCSLALGGSNWAHRPGGKCARGPGSCLVAQRPQHIWRSHREAWTSTSHRAVKTVITSKIVLNVTVDILLLFRYQVSDSLLRQEPENNWTGKRRAQRDRLITVAEEFLGLAKQRKSSVCIAAKKRTLVLMVVSPSVWTVGDTSPAWLGREATCKRPTVPCASQRGPGLLQATQLREARWGGWDSIRGQRDTPAELTRPVLETACPRYLF